MKPSDAVPQSRVESSSYDDSVIMLLVGPSSSGKTSTARALQQKMGRTSLYLPADVVQYGPLKEWPTTHSEALALEQGCDARYYRILVAAADNIVVIGETAFLYDEQPKLFQEITSNVKTVTIHISAPLEALKARESARGDRVIGTAMAHCQHEVKNVPYDLILNSAELSIDSMAEAIVQKWSF